MGIETILTPAIISSIVTCILGIIFGYLFNKKLEKFKILLNIQEQLNLKKLELYPKLDALIYRIRNLCREIVTDFSSISTIKSNLNKVSVDLENAVIEYKIYLDDSTFKIVHKFKNNTIYFSRLIDDLQFYHRHSEISSEDKIKDDISKLFNEIEENYQSIAKKLSFTKPSIT